MAINIVENIQKNLGFPELQKIDPNTQEVKKPENMSAQNYFARQPFQLFYSVYINTHDYKEGNTELFNGEFIRQIAGYYFW